MKCPVCGYEYEFECGTKATNYKNVVIKGDKAFVKIMMPQFNDDRFKIDVEYWDGECDKCYLYGCPKCKTVQFYI